MAVGLKESSSPMVGAKRREIIAIVGDGTNKKARKVRQVRRNNGRVGKHFNKRGIKMEILDTRIHIFSGIGIQVSILK